MPVLATTLFGPQFFSVNTLSNEIAGYLVFCMTHSSWRSLSNGCMFLYKSLSDISSY